MLIQYPRGQSLVAVRINFMPVTHNLKAIHTNEKQKEATQTGVLTDRRTNSGQLCVLLMRRGIAVLEDHLWNVAMTLFQGRRRSTNAILISIDSAFTRCHIACLID